MLKKFDRMHERATWSASTCDRLRELLLHKSCDGYVILTSIVFKINIYCEFKFSDKKAQKTKLYTR